MGPHTATGLVPERYRRMVLASRPVDKPDTTHFRLEEVGMPGVAAGQVLVRNRYLSIDPYMVGRMYTTQSYAAAQALGETMVGETAGHVIASQHPDFQIGDAVVGALGWQEYGVSDGTNLRRVDEQRAPLSAYLGMLGMTGVTAWYGINRICRPVEGDTVLVSAAAGAVGGVAVQLAKAKGCKVIGIAGGEQKCHYVTRVLGANACIDYRPLASKEALTEEIFKHAVDGVDAFFDNVNGWVLDAAFPAMSLGGRIALCGMIGRYGNRSMQLLSHHFLLLSRLTAQGFIVWDHVGEWGRAVDELSDLMDGGLLRSEETRAFGIEAAPHACLGLLAGKNVGKQLVQFY
ncbi:zinc-binding dehydrogenase [Parapusillimonas granuli]|uniref:Zinc-binding dehydrogenase n=2 Tax=Parapusillimonas granuli TaxID=380911 RepID=A0A853G129_9BURK|nr:zinc-binding dehydrogenase [Parapusillimonas granuli]